MDSHLTAIRDVTCHMGSHSVTCYPTQVNAPRSLITTLPSQNWCSLLVDLTTSHFYCVAFERIVYVVYKLAVLAYWCLHELAPAYLADVLHPVNDLPGRRRLRSSSTSAVVVLSTRLSIIGDRGFTGNCIIDMQLSSTGSHVVDNTIDIQIHPEDLSVFFSFPFLYTTVSAVFCTIHLS